MPWYSAASLMSDPAAVVGSNCIPSGSTSSVQTCWTMETRFATVFFVRPSRSTSFVGRVTGAFHTRSIRPPLSTKCFECLDFESR